VNFLLTSHASAWGVEFGPFGKGGPTVVVTGVPACRGRKAKSKVANECPRQTFRCHLGPRHGWSNYFSIFPSGTLL